MKILVTGASGVVGGPLADRCEALGLDVIRSGRRDRGTRWLAWDMAQPPPAAAGGLDCVLHAAPLWVLPVHVQALAGIGVERIICYSSTSALTKQDSSNSSERELAESLRRAERRITEESARCGVATTIFRPTMIYGYGRDGNVSAIARFIRRYGFFAVAGRAGGKRQPVHVDDLVDAAVSILDKPNTHGRTYNLGGGETLTYRAMVERVFQALGRPARILGVPAGAYQSVLAVASLVKRDITGAMAVRMNRDMAFDWTDARADFGFSPQAFLEHPERDLPSP